MSQPKYVLRDEIAAAFDTVLVSIDDEIAELRKLRASVVKAKKAAKTIGRRASLAMSNGTRKANPPAFIAAERAGYDLIRNALCMGKGDLSSRLSYSPIDLWVKPVYPE